MDTAKCKLWLKALFCFIVMSLACTGLAASKHDERFTRMHYGLAQGTYQIGDYSGTLQSLSILLKQHPEHLAALQLKAQTEWELGRYQESERTLQEAARIQPDNEITQALQSALLWQGKRQGLLERARRLAKEELFEQALFALDKHPDWLLADPQLAKLYLNLSLREENWSALEQLLHKLPDHFLGVDYRNYLLGRLQLAKGDLPAAKAQFAAAHQHKPAASLHHSILFYRANCTIQDSQQEANGDAEVVLALDAGFRPETLSEFQIATTSLLHQNEPKRALELLESALHSRVAENALYWLTLSRVQLANHRPERAISASTQAISLQANLVPAYVLRARAHTSRKEFAQAKLDYHQALAIQPTRFDIHYALAINCLYLTQIEAAYTALQNASQIEQTSEFWLIFAVLAQANGQLSEAKSALNQYQSRQPASYSTSANYLSILLNQARKRPGKLPSKNSSDSHYFQQFHRGHLDGATLLDQRLQAQLASATSAQQNCALFYWMAQSYQARSLDHEALSYFRKAVKTGSPNWIEWHLAQWQLQKGTQTTTR